MRFQDTLKNELTLTNQSGNITYVCFVHYFCCFYFSKHGKDGLHENYETCGVPIKTTVHSMSLCATT